MTSIVIHSRLHNKRSGLNKKAMEKMVKINQRSFPNKRSDGENFILPNRLECLSQFSFSNALAQKLSLKNVVSEG